MRRILTRVLLMAVAAALLAGCGVTVDQHVTVRPDGGADVVISTLLPRFAWEQLQRDQAFDLTALEEQIRAQHPGTDLWVEAVSGEEQAGFRVHASFATVEEAVRFLTTPAEEGAQPLLSHLVIQRQGGLAGHRYTVEAKTDGISGGESLPFMQTGGLSEEDMRQVLKSMLKVQLAVTLPAPVASVQGEGVEVSEDRRTVRWTVPLDKPASLQATSVTVRPPTLWAGAGLAAVVLAGLVAVAVRRRAEAF